MTEELHPPPDPPDTEEFIGCKVDRKLLKGKMKLGGYINKSQFLRDVIDSYGVNGEKKLRETIRDEINKLQQNLLKNLQMIPLEGKSTQRELLEQEYEQARARRSSAHLPVQGNKDNVEVVKELKDTIDKLGDIRKLLEEAPEEELEEMNKRRQERLKQLE